MRSALPPFGVPNFLMLDKHTRREMGNARSFSVVHNHWLMGILKVNSEALKLLSDSVVFVVVSMFYARESFCTGTKKYFIELCFFWP